MTIVPYKAEHLAILSEQPSQKSLRALMDDPSYAKSLEREGHSFSGFVGDKLIGCAGVIPLWQGRSHAWAILAHDAGKHFISMHKGVSRFLDNHPANRVETTVAPAFGPAHRWMRALGFHWEGLMQKYNPDGSDMDLYARIS